MEDEAMEGMDEVSIYVLPTDEPNPPRAIIGREVEADLGPIEIKGMEGVLAVWSRDAGCWMIDEVPVPDELGEAITEHAKSLGVEW